MDDGRLILPGENLTRDIICATNEVKIGRGLVVNDKNEVTVDSVGLLIHRPPSYYWVESSSKRYGPRVGDQVVGVIEDRGGDFYVVNIYSGSHCVLNRLAFDGATKRNKPELRRGDVVYAKVITAAPDSDIELACTGAPGMKKEWSTGETIYGELSDGVLLHLSIDHARHLLHPDCPVLNALSKYFTFEVAIGMNGAVWLRGAGGDIRSSASTGSVRPEASSLIETIVIRNAILNSQYLDKAQTIAMVEKLASLAKKLKLTTATRDLQFPLVE